MQLIVLETRTKKGFSQIPSFTMGQNNDFMTKNLYVRNCYIL